MISRCTSVRTPRLWSCPQRCASLRPVDQRRGATGMGLLVRFCSLSTIAMLFQILELDRLLQNVAPPRNVHEAHDEQAETKLCSLRMLLVHRRDVCDGSIEAVLPSEPYHQRYGRDEDLDQFLRRRLALAILPRIFLRVVGDPVEDEDAEDANAREHHRHNDAGGNACHIKLGDTRADGHPSVAGAPHAAPSRGHGQRAHEALDQLSLHAAFLRLGGVRVAMLLRGVEPMEPDHADYRA
mmetsp:Transcript_24011/g.69080  ORF Transcript_24011/g.69080 Transcript_24011/m.69080 type:complete len:239 (+) Transcript_24011:98-814(+)